jgi:hypothetical protein
MFDKDIVILIYLVRYWDKKLSQFFPRQPDKGE